MPKRVYSSDRLLPRIRPSPTRNRNPSLGPKSAKSSGTARGEPSRSNLFVYLCAILAQVLTLKLADRLSEAVTQRGAAAMFFIVAGNSTASLVLSVAFSLGWCWLSQYGAPNRWLYENLPWLMAGYQGGMVLTTLCVIFVPIVLVWAMAALCRRGDLTVRRKRRRAELHTLINRLPIETWLCQQSRRHAPVADIRARLQRRHLKMPAGVLEKEEYVSQLERAPHDTLCSICYEDYSDGDPLRLLRCAHYFHVECALRRPMLRPAPRTSLSSDAAS